DRRHHGLGAARAASGRAAGLERQSRRAMDHRLEQRRSLPLRQQSKTWARWHLPGDGPQPYAVYVDETDAVWVSDWGANAILRFDPKTEKFGSFLLPDRMPACGSSRAGERDRLSAGGSWIRTLGPAP